MALHPQGQFAAPAAEGGVRGAAHPRPGAGNLAAPLGPGAAPPAGPLGPAEGAAPQPGQPLRGEASGWWAWETGPRSWVDSLGLSQLGWIPVGVCALRLGEGHTEAQRKPEAFEGDEHHGW